MLRHDIGDKQKVGTVSEAFPHLVLENFGSKLGERVGNILKYLFPVPKPESKRVITLANRNDYISFRHHTFDMPKVRRWEMALPQATSGGASSWSTASAAVSVPTAL